MAHKSHVARQLQLLTIVPGNLVKACPLPEDSVIPIVKHFLQLDNNSGVTFEWATVKVII